MDELRGLPTTDPELLDVLRRLRDLEPLFHREGPGAGEAELDRRMAPDFWEVGASGACYSRAHVLDTLLRRFAREEPEEPWETSDFRCRRLGPDTYLLTYALRQGSSRTRRSTVWTRSGDDWQVVHHQGTVVASDQ